MSVQFASTVILGLILGCMMRPASGIKEIQPWGTAVHGEYCDYESFRASCKTDEIILMQSARYGHMALGRCIETDLGFLGCSEDVMGIMDSRCTGKSECEMDVRDQALRETQPCVKGIVLYLDASYTCVKGKGAVCRPLRASMDTSYISSVDIFNNNCQDRTSIDIEAIPGQSINLTLINLDTEVTERSVYGLAIEESGNELQVVVDGGVTSSIGVTASSKVSVVLDHTYRNQKFLIGYNAVGCPDIAAPHDTSFDRDGNTATVSCIDSQQSWQLTCRDVHWLGVIGNCTKKAPVVVADQVRSVTDDKEEEWPLAMPKETIMVVIVCSTIFIAVIVVTTGCVVLHRSKIKRRLDLNGRGDYTTMHRLTLAKERPNSDYLVPQSTKPSAAQNYDIPLPEIPLTDSMHQSGAAKKNNEDDYTTDYSRKYFVLDQDYMALNNIRPPNT